ERRQVRLHQGGATGAGPAGGGARSACGEAPAARSRREVVWSSSSVGGTGRLRLCTARYPHIDRGLQNGRLPSSDPPAPSPPEMEGLRLAGSSADGPLRRVHFHVYADGVLRRRNAYARRALAVAATGH